MINKISMLGVLAMIFFLTRCGNQNNNAEIQSASVASTNVETQSEDGQMLNQIINYTSDGRVTMETFIHSDTEKPLSAIVVLPGGAFGMLDYPEGEPVARTFHVEGTDKIQDSQTDILTGNEIDVGTIRLMPEFYENLQVLEAINAIIERFPEKEAIDY